MERWLAIATVTWFGCEAAVERLEPTAASLSFETVAADAGEESGCDLVDGWGCRPTDKCIATVSTAGARRVCVAEGSAGVGQACAVDEASGRDDCARGLRCAGGVCKELCRSAPDSCPPERYCAPLGGELGREGVGVCETACDLFVHDCGAGESCYLALGERDFATLCAPGFPEPPRSVGGCGVPGATAAGVSGDCCSYVNTCASGYACVSSHVGAQPDEGVCAFLCDPIGAVEGAPTACDPPGPGPAPAYVCVSLRDLAPAAADLPVTIGVCVEAVRG